MRSLFSLLFDSSSAVDAEGQLLPTSVAGALIGIILLAFLWSRADRKHSLPLPPGPKSLPLLGNLLDIPLTEEWMSWQTYVKQYGDLVFLSAHGNNFLLPGNHQVIKELLEKRVNFNDRPHSTMLNDLMDFIWLLSSSHYGDRWRRGRKLLHTQAHAGAAIDFAPIQLQGARRLVRDLLTAEPGRPADRSSNEANAILPSMIRKNVGVTAIRMLYGIDVRDPIAEAKYVDVSETVMSTIGEAGKPGRFLVDLFPITKFIPSWFPGAHFQRWAQEARDLHIRMREGPLEIAGSTPLSIAGRMLENFPQEESLIKDLAGALYVAGSDTTVGALTAFFLAALIYPETQVRAQEELDRVIGRHRLPEFSDKADIPYLDAFMRECLRWLPLLPTGVPHATTENDEFRGYIIPKGTIVLPFQWGLLQDPESYPNPSTFSPERYLNHLPDGTWNIRTDVPDPRMYAFGFGRRACPGIHIAEQSMFVTFATLLHTLDVVRAKDEEGQEVVPDICLTSGLSAHILPFPYELCMRANAQELVDMCVASAGLIF